MRFAAGLLIGMVADERNLQFLAPGAGSSDRRQLGLGEGIHSRGVFYWLLCFRMIISRSFELDGNQS